MIQDMSLSQENAVPQNKRNWKSHEGKERLLWQYFFGDKWIKTWKQ